MAQMTFLDFFSGIGGFRKGFELCGMRCVGHCEIDKYADRSYRAIHNVKEDEWYAADITKVTPQTSPEQTCGQQDSRVRIFRSAAFSEGLTEQEADSFFTLAELVKGQNPENRPTWIILENVKNLPVHSWRMGLCGRSRYAGPHSATISSTDFSIQRISAPLKTESGYSLSLADILEPEVDPKYFLSQRAVEKLLSNS